MRKITSKKFFFKQKYLLFNPRSSLTHGAERMHVLNFLKNFVNGIHEIVNGIHKIVNGIHNCEWLRPTPAAGSWSR